MAKPTQGCRHETELPFRDYLFETKKDPWFEDGWVDRIPILGSNWVREDATNHAYVIVQALAQ